MSMPLVSIVIINWNCQDWVPEALRSCLSQDFSDFEVVFVDDCSTDASVEVAKSVAAGDPRVRFFSTETNSGIGKARNLGVSMAQGRFIAFLDSDDKLLPSTLSTCVADFERLEKDFPNLVMLMYDAWLISERGKRRGRFLPAGYRDVDRCDHAPTWTLPSSWFVLRERIVPFGSRYRFGGHSLFAERMSRVGKIVLVGHPNFEYRLRFHSVTNDKAEIQLREIRAVRKTVELGCWDDPVALESVPRPSRKDVVSWSAGRSAKAAYVNGRYCRAACFLLKAFFVTPGVVWAKVRRNFTLKR